MNEITIEKSVSTVSALLATTLFFSAPTPLKCVTTVVLRSVLSLT
jgi:hypothetical protein